MARHCPPSPIAGSEAELAAVAAALGAREVTGFSRAEAALLEGAGPAPRDAVTAARDAIAAGQDPLGDAFCRLRSAAVRRRAGATYTPATLVGSMVDWCSARVTPARVVDPGCGSARFLVAAAPRFRDAVLLGIEKDPLAALTARAHLAACGLASRSRVRLEDYRAVELSPARGPTLFVGNPPYVRHHDIEPSWKRWLARQAAGLGLRASGLCGLHLHFYLATALHARAGDVGCFVTAAEWLDVNYGQLARQLLAGPLGLARVDVMRADAMPFADAQSTAAIAGFELGRSAATAAVRLDAPVGAPLEGGRLVPRAELAGAPRWTSLRRRRRPRPGWVELGELCRVHRGQVTGANKVWIASAHTPPLPPGVLWPTVTRARQLFEAGPTLASAAHLPRVVDLPRSLDAFGDHDRRLVDDFLQWARERGAHERFVARHRKPWWTVGLRAPAPILATYMARRPPAFVRNLAGARHINIAHGLYPREPMTDRALDALAAALNGAATLADGRTYAGGLTKFEPREMERLLVPDVTVISRAA